MPPAPRTPGKIESVRLFQEKSLHDVTRILYYFHNNVATVIRFLGLPSNFDAQCPVEGIVWSHLELVFGLSGMRR